MGELAQLLTMGAFVALALAIAIVVRRAGRVIGETRDIEVFRRAVKDLAGRAEASLGGLSTRIDGVRRQTIPPQDVADNLTAAADAVTRYLAEARAFHGPPGTSEIRDALAQELERAGRAIQMIEHGCSILAAARRGNRELEAQTAVKRGYLNLLHAREGIARQAIRTGQIPRQEAPLFERRV